MNVLKKAMGLLCTVSLIVGLLAGCGGTGTSSQAGGNSAGTKPKGDAIKVGLSASLTGNVAAGGLRMKQAVTMLVEEVNADGGINGRPIELIIVDDQSTPTGAVNAVNKLIGDGVVAIVGPHLSSCAAAVNDILMKAEIPFTPGGTSPMLLDLQNPYFFRPASPENVQFKLGAQYMQDHYGKNNRVAMLYNNDEAGRGAMTVVENFCKENSIEFYAEGHNSGDKDMTGQLTKIKEFNPDYLMFYGHDPETAVTVRQLSELNMDIPFAASSALAMAQVLDLVDSSAVAGKYCITDYVPDVEDTFIADFIKRFETRWDETPERYAALHYSGAMAVIEGLRTAENVDDPTSVRNAMKQIGNLQTVMGIYNCDENGELLHSAVITQIDENKAVVVKDRQSL